MHKLFEILKRARPQVDWFALGVAIRLAEEIEKLDESDVERVVDVANRTMEFLRYRPIPTCVAFSKEISDALFELE